MNQFSQFPFANLFESTDVNVDQWKDSILHQIEEYAFIPRYIANSEDAIQFWSAVARFFAYYTTHAYKLSQFDNDKTLEEFLLERDLILRSDQSSNDLITFVNQFFVQIIKRGANSVFDIDQEFSRLIERSQYDDLDSYLPQNHLLTWTLNRHSPLIQSEQAKEHSKLLKGDFKDFLSLTNVSTIGSPTLTTDSEKKILTINNANTVGGTQKKILINNDLDYELTLMIKTSSTVTLSLKVFDTSGNELTCISTKGGNTNIFCTNAGVRSDRYVFIRAIIFNKGYSQDQSSLNINVGNNLILPTNAAYIVPQISVNSTASLWALNIKQLALATSLFYIQAINYIHTFLINRSQTSLPLIKRAAEERLIPYNSKLFLTDRSTTKDQPCINNTTPNWQPTGNRRCRVVNGAYTGEFEVQYRDINKCTSRGLKWEIETGPCTPDLGNRICTVNTEKRESNYFSYNSKLFRIKETTTCIENGNITTSIQYKDEVITSTRSTDPIWSNIGTIYCDGTYDQDCILMSIAIEKIECDSPALASFSRAFSVSFNRLS